MKKLLTLLCILGYAAFTNAQTCSPFTQTMFFQDFENPTSSTLPEIVNSGATTMGYYTSTGYFIGARSRSVNNASADVDYGNVNASFASNVKVNFYFAPINIDNDFFGDYITFYVSRDGGSTWSAELDISSTNSSSLTYDFTTISTYSFNYDGNNAPNYLYINSSNKINKIEMSIANTFDLSNLRIGYIIRNNNGNDRWIIDDIKITGDFIDTKTWNGTSWTGRNTNAPTSTEIAIINGDYNTGTNGNISACKCTVNSTRTLTIAANSNVTLQNDLINNGTINVENNGNLIQVNNSGTFTGNNITVKRKANMKRLNYTYWSSPVSGQNLKNFSPSTLDTRFYVYNESNDYFDGVFAYSSYPGFIIANAFPLQNKTTYNFVPAKGYAIRAPNNYTNANQTVDFTFTGVPNNGTQTITITKNGAGNNLVGNPYPSNISFSDFYAANSSTINPIVHFWTNTDPNPPANQQGSSYSGNNYATRNLTGGTPAMGSSVIPTDNIVVGQGFIVQKTNSGSSSLTFNNSMRKTTSGTFFNSKMSSKIESPKYWLKLKTPVQNFNTILIGYVDGATNALDLGYDAEPISESSDLFYSIVNEKKLIIQGRNPNFSVYDRIPLGATFFEAGNYEISIPEKEGIFNGSQDIYLKDKLLNTTVKLTDAPYQFYAESGDVANRFEIIYAPETVLGVDENKTAGFVIYEYNDNIVIENRNQKITEIEIYDASGRLIKTTKPNDNKVTYTKNNFQKGVLVFKLKTKDKITSKKFLVK